MIPILTGCTPVPIEETHIHEVVFNPANPDEVLLASHVGLLKLKPNGKAYRIGQTIDDFMSFAIDPTNPDIMYRSGHPRKGGNSGFWKTKNGGKSWEKISKGNPNRNADFHALLVHPANPAHMYGWFKLRVHRSKDSGETWEILPNQPPEVFAFAGHPDKENILYIATFDGIWQSQDYGENWKQLIGQFSGGLALDVVSASASKLYIAMRSQGFFVAEQDDKGNWNTAYLGHLPNEEVPLQLAVHPTNNSVMYSISKSGVIYRSADEAKTWHAVSHGLTEEHEHSEGEHENHKPDEH